ncbi:hypothetical protein ACIRBY_36885 [Streptomyces sp. NPDC096136]|uniref:hypothetical protein n=1 Tax=Streptomyces sp. NPDC096136 TaxID=3366076 RepID=UPI003804802D
MALTALCQGEGCRRPDADGRSRRRTADGGRLCRPCRERLDAGLAELTHLYEECGRMLAGAAPGSLRERTTGGDLPGLPFNGAAADVRARMVSVLGSWSGLVAQERGFASPPRTVAALTAFLRRNGDWLAAHPAAAEATEEIARLVRAGRRAAFPEPTRSIRLGACPESGCAGSLTVAVRDTDRDSVRDADRDGDRDTDRAVVCDADPAHRWTSDQWSRLSLSLEAGGRSAAPRAAATERWLTAADIARLWNTPTGTVYRLASEQKWRRRNRAGRTYYNETDVRTCFDRRAAART